MRTEEITIYKFSELSDDAKENIKRYMQENDWFDYIGKEITDSFKQFLAMLGLSERDYEYSFSPGYGRSYFKPFFNNIQGHQWGSICSIKRRMAWLENTLLSKCRIPWSGPRRNSVRKYGIYYRPGKVKPCPFTGVCYDEEILDYLRKEFS